MALVRAADVQPIPGYRLIEPLGSGGFAEVWKCEAPGGLLKAVKFVYGNLKGLGEEAVAANQEFGALQRVKSIRHPFLLTMERVEIISGELVIVMELADRNLYDRFQECRDAGLPGVPREELLGYLRDAAEALDLMNIRHHLEHLDIKPRNLFLVSNRVKVADFGLVNDLRELAGQAPAFQLGGITPRYAAPEVFQGLISHASDQYSLAITYQEMLTGTLPFAGKNRLQLARQHVTAEPDLSGLPPGDRSVIGRALAKNPEERFPSCMSLVRRLASGRSKTPTTMMAIQVPPSYLSRLNGQNTSEPETRKELCLDNTVPLGAHNQCPVECDDPQAIYDELLAECNASPAESAEPPAGVEAIPEADGAGSQNGAAAPAVEAPETPPQAAIDSEPTPNQLVIRLYASAAASLRMLQDDQVRYWLDGEGTLQHRFGTPLSPTEVRQRLAGFQEEWNAKRIPNDFGLVVFDVPVGWLWPIGRRMVLRLQVPRSALPGTLTPVAVRVEASRKRLPRPGLPIKPAAWLLRAVGPLFASLREHLQAVPEQRIGERLVYTYPSRVREVSPDQQLSPEISCRGKDVSLTGMGLLMPYPPQGPRLYIYPAPAANLSDAGIPAAVVRARPHIDGQQHEVGVQFLLGGQCPNAHDDSAASLRCYS